MKKSHYKYLSVVLVAIVFLSVFNIFSVNHPRIHAQTVCNNGTMCLSGWAWSSNVGWVSFNSKNLGTSPSYEVDIDDVGNLSGHAWSSNVGWISFNRNETQNPPSSDIGTTILGMAGPNRIASIDPNSGSVTGWARALKGCLGDMWDSVNYVCLGTGPGSDNGVMGVSGPGLATTSTSILWGPQDQIMYEFFTATNNTSQTLSGLRFVIASSTFNPAGINGSNISGTDSSGYKYVQYNYPVAPGQTINAHLSFYDSSRRSTGYLPIKVYAIASPLSEPTLPANASSTNNVSISYYPTGGSYQLTSTLSPTTYVQSPAFNILQIRTPNSNEAVAIQYSDDGGLTWHMDYGPGSGAVRFVASNTSLFYLDYGVPDTNLYSSIRQYKVYIVPSGTFTDRSVANAGMFTPIVSSNTGWDGWIHLSDNQNHPTQNFLGTGGVTYASSTSQFMGYAWGSSVIGWLKFIPTVCLGSGCTLSINVTGTCTVTYIDSSGNPQTTSSNVQLASSTGSVTYTASSTSGVGPYSYNGTASTSLPYSFTLSYGPGSLLKPTVSVQDSASPTNSGDIGQYCPTITVAGGAVNNICKAPNHALLCSNASTTSAVLSGVASSASCNADQCNFYCTGTGFKLNRANTACVKSGTIIEQ